MFISHIPAGYITTKLLQKKWNTKKYLLVGLFASILPDLDLLYFYFIDNKSSLHHSYWIHQPFWWLIISIITTLILLIKNQTNYKIFASIFYINIFLHLLLDTVVGKIGWLYPFLDKSYSFFEVPVQYEWWIYNFVFHWTFLFELLILCIALALFFMNLNYQKKRIQSL